MCLPYWRGELDIETGSWAFTCRVRNAVSLAGLHSELLKRLSAGALSLESELLYLCGQSTGVAGSVLWEETALGQNADGPIAPFTLVFGYSREMECFSVDFSGFHDDVRAAIAQCTFRSGTTRLSTCKGIAFVAVQLPFDEVKLLCDMAKALSCWHGTDVRIPFYAEQLGYLHAPVAYETDPPMKLLTMQHLEDFQLDATRAVLGPSPSIPLPELYQQPEKEIALE